MPDTFQGWGVAGLQEGVFHVRVGLAGSQATAAKVVSTLTTLLTPLDLVAIAGSVSVCLVWRETCGSRGLGVCYNWHGMSGWSSSGYE